MNKQLFIFDLDNTLYDMSNIKNSIMEKEWYKNKLVNFLKHLQETNKQIAICTYNLFPFYTIRIHRPELLQFFNEKNVLYPLTKNGFIFYEKKSIMIIRYAQKNNIKKEDIILFDDLESNIQDVEKAGITGVLVNTKTGLNFINPAIN